MTKEHTQIQFHRVQEYHETVLLVKIGFFEAAATEDHGHEVEHGKVVFLGKCFFGEPALLSRQ